jgi:hypothetical protein
MPENGLIRGRKRRSMLYFIFHCQLMVASNNGCEYIVAVLAGKGFYAINGNDLRRAHTPQTN